MLQAGIFIDKKHAKWAGGAAVNGTPDARDAYDDDVRALDQGRRGPWLSCLVNAYINTSGSSYPLSTDHTTTPSL